MANFQFYMIFIKKCDISADPRSRLKMYSYIKSSHDWAFPLRLISPTNFCNLSQAFFYFHVLERCVKCRYMLVYSIYHILLRQHNHTLTNTRYCSPPCVLPHHSSHIVYYLNNIYIYPVIWIYRTVLL